MNIKHLIDAIHALAPGAEWKFTNDDLDSLEWFSPTIPQPSKKAILDQAKIEEEQELQERENRQMARESALAKLAAIGLTEEEIAAL